MRESREKQSSGYSGVTKLLNQPVTKSENNLLEQLANAYRHRRRKEPK